MAGFQKRGGRRTKLKRGQGPQVGGPFCESPDVTTNELVVREPVEIESLQVQEPRVIVVFGSPLSGVTEALQILHEVCRTNTNLVCSTDWLNEAEKSRDEGCPVTLVDASVQDAEVQDAYDRRLVCPGSGALIRLWSSTEEALRRAREKGRSDVTADSISEWGKNILGLEDHIHTLNLPYFMVPNEYGHLANTIAELARHAGINN